MAKMSKWIIKFLLGRKEEKKSSKIDAYFPPTEFPTNDAQVQAATPKVRRRWSFKRLGSGEMGHKFTRSVDSIDTAQLAVSKPLLRVVPGNIWNDAAATKIQSVFRSYLARKALRALRALVKLQALVRGYLVRKRTSATLRCMHALMSIQVRARVHRIQMAEDAEPEFDRRRPIHSRNLKNEVMEMNDGEICRVPKSKSGSFDFLNIRRIDHGFTTYYSGDLSALNQQRQYEYYPSLPNTPQNLSTAKSSRASFALDQIDVPDFVPHYMSNTESSRAKARSQSEPKQRPKRRERQKKNQRTASVDGSAVPIETQTKDSAFRMRDADGESKDLWFVKLYRQRRSFKDSESDSIGTTNCSRSIIEYEPHVMMY